MAAVTEIVDSILASPFSLVSIGLVVLAIAIMVLVIWVVSLDKRTRGVVDGLEVERRKVAEMQMMMGCRGASGARPQQGAPAGGRAPQSVAGVPGAQAQGGGRAAQQPVRGERVAQQPVQQQERRVPRQVAKAQVQAQAAQPQVQAQTARSRSQQAPAAQRVAPAGANVASAGAARASQRAGVGRAPQGAAAGAVGRVQQGTTSRVAHSAGATNRGQQQASVGKTAGRVSQARSNSGYVSIPRGDADAQAQAASRAREQQAKAQARVSQAGATGSAANNRVAGGATGAGGATRGRHAR